MKIIIIVLSRIQQYFQLNKVIFLFFFLGSVISCITFTYFYGNTLTYKTQQTKDVYMYRHYIIYPKNNNFLEYNQLSRLLKYDIADISYESPLQKGQAEINHTYIDPTINNFVIKSSFCNAIYGQSYSGKNQFTKMQMDEGQNVIIVPDGLTELSDNLGTMKLNGKTFNIIGIHSSPNEFVIPTQTYKKMALPVQNVSILLNHKLSSEQNQKILQDMQSIFKDATIQNPDTLYNDAKNQMPKELVLLYILYFISLLSFMFLMQYMIEKTFHENIIYLIAGASKGTILQILFIENIVLTTISAAIGIPIHIALYSGIFEKINMFSNIVYYPRDYFIIYLSMVFVSALTMLPFIRNCYKHSFIALKNVY